MTVGPRLLLKRSLKSKHSRRAKADTITTTPMLGQWIDAHMKSFYLMIENSRSWIVCYAADVVGNGASEVVGPFEAAKKKFFKGTVILILHRLVWRSKQGLQNSYHNA
jgi:hypothetical protein